VLREIVRFPDPRLSTRAEPPAGFDRALAELADDLAETMRAAPGIGITAPHVGVPVRLVVVQTAPDQPVRCFVDPVVVESGSETARHEEGSVSMPGVTDLVERPARVRIAWRTLEGEPREAWMEGLDAVVLQHEIDQLDGVFWIERLSRLRRDRVLKRWDKLRRGR
jgi:peptide deformylase